MLRQINILEDKIRLQPKSPKRKIWEAQLASLRNKMKSGGPWTAPLAPPSVGDIDYKIVAPKIYDAQSAAASYLEDDEIAMKSVLNFLNPDTKQYRFPDSVTNPTNLLRSIREYLIYANFDGSPDAGRWSFAVQPSIGSLTDLTQFAVAIVDSSTAWPSDVYNPGSYVSSSNGQDPRLDSTLLELLQSKTGAYCATLSVAIGYTTLLNQHDGYLLNPANNPNVLLQSLKIEFTNLGPTATFNGTGGPVTVRNAAVYNIPPGTYNFQMSLESLPEPASGGAQTSIMAIDENNVLLGYITNGVTPTSVGYFATNSRTLSNANTSFSGTTTETVLESTSVNIRIRPGVRIVPTYFLSVATTLTLINSYVLINSVVDSSLASFDNSQMVSTLRPLGMSCLFTNILPDLYAGGNLVAYSAPSGDVRNIYGQNNSLAVAQKWEQLALLNKGNLMYDGPQKDGTFVFTQPWSEADLLLRTPDDFQAHAYQGIIVSGQVSAGASLTGVQAIGRLRVVTTYEYVTDSPIFTPKSLVGNGLESGKVLSFLSATQHALPNNKHLAYLNKVVDTGGKILKTAETAMPVLLKGLSALSSML